MDEVREPINSVREQTVTCFTLFSCVDYYSSLKMGAILCMSTNRVLRFKYEHVLYSEMGRQLAALLYLYLPPENCRHV
jgi:hypothetical protein